MIDIRMHDARYKTKFQFNYITVVLEIEKYTIFTLCLRTK